MKKYLFLYSIFCLTCSLFAKDDEIKLVGLDAIKASKYYKNSTKTTNSKINKQKTNKKDFLKLIGPIELDKDKSKTKKVLKTKSNTKKNINQSIKKKKKSVKKIDNGILLKDAILISLNRSNKILSLREKVIQQKYKLKTKEALFKPNITLYANTGYNYIHTRSSNDTEDSYPTGDLQLYINENLYAGGKHINELKKERALLKSENAKFRSKVEEETLKIIEAYIDLYYQQKAIEIEKENMKNLQKILKIVEIKAKNGVTTKGDLNNIKSKVENASSALVKATSKYQNALSFYQYFVGKDIKKLPSEGKFLFKEYKKDDLLKIAQEKNAKLQITRYKIEAQKFDLKAKKAAFYPTIDFIITAKEKFSDGANDPYRDEKATAMLSLSYNLYKGGADKARVDSSLSKIRELQYKYIDILDSTKYNIIQLFENIHSIKESMKHTFNEVAANKKALNSYWSAFKYGNQDIQALLLAQRALNRSEQDKLKEHKEYIMGYFKLLANSGELLEFLKVEDFVNVDKY